MSRGGRMSKLRIRLGFVARLVIGASITAGSCVSSQSPALAGEAFVNLRRTRPETQVPFPEIRDWKSLRITLGRRQCLGTCPAYDVEIDGDGSVTFTGYQFVAVKGIQKYRIPIEKVRELVERFRQAKYFWTFDDYAAPVTDFPAFQTSISFDGRTKRVGDYDGEYVGMPAEISRLEDAIDETAGTDRWIKAGGVKP